MKNAVNLSHVIFAFLKLFKNQEIIREKWIFIINKLDKKLCFYPKIWNFPFLFENTTSLFLINLI